MKQQSYEDVAAAANNDNDIRLNFFALTNLKLQREFDPFLLKPPKQVTLDL